MREKTEGIYQYKHQFDCSCKPAGKNPAITNISSAKPGGTSWSEQTRAQDSTRERQEEDGREAERPGSGGQQAGGQGGKGKAAVFQRPTEEEHSKESWWTQSTANKLKHRNSWELGIPFYIRKLSFKNSVPILQWTEIQDPYFLGNKKQWKATEGVYTSQQSPKEQRGKKTEEIRVQQGEDFFQERRNKMNMLWFQSDLPLSCSHSLVYL